MPKISGLSNKPSLEETDIIPVVNMTGTKITKRFSLSTLKTWLQSLVTWVTSGMIDYSSGVWWEEIGRAELSSDGDTISITNLPPRKHLQIRLTIFGTGNIGPLIRFNGDTGSKYSWSISNNGAAAATGTSTTSIAISGSTDIDGCLVTADIINIESQEKIVVGFRSQPNIDGAAGASEVGILSGKWADKTEQIDEITIGNSGTGDFLAGSELVVLGHD